MNTEPPPLKATDLMGKQSVSGEAARPATRLQRYMEKNGHRYRELHIDAVHGKNVRIRLMVPQSELEGEKEKQNSDWYTGSVRQALETNDDVFGIIPQDKTYLFVETTQDWNDYVGDDPNRQKKQGDRHHGLAGDDILCFTPRGMRTETNAELGDRPAAEYVRIVLDHETAHVAIEEKYGQNQKKFPNWISEGVPMLVCSDLSENISHELAQRMWGFFGEYPVPPADVILGSYRYEGREDKSPVMYTYGEQFLKWLIAQDAKLVGQPDGARKAAVVPLLDMLAAQQKPDFKTAFQTAFGQQYQDAYSRFVSYLKSAS